MKDAPCHVGCDVSLDALDLCTLSSGRAVATRIANSPQAIATLVCELAARSGVLVVLEASGGYEAALLEALWQAEIPVARVDPRRVRRFAEAQGEKAKTDRVDARVLAEFGLRMTPEPTPDPGQGTRHLKALLTRRRSLAERRKAEACQLKQARFADLREMALDEIARLKAMISALDRRIAQLVAAQPALADRAARLRSVPGIGPVTAAVCLASLAELGRLGRAQVASLTGVAPFARESGTWRGTRRCRGGRKELRDTLWMAATSAALHTSSRFATFYRRLRTAGKPHKLAITAVIRKLVVTLNAIVRDNTVFAH